MARAAIRRFPVRGRRRDGGSTGAGDPPRANPAADKKCLLIGWIQQVRIAQVDPIGSGGAEGRPSYTPERG